MTIPLKRSLPAQLPVKSRCENLGDLRVSEAIFLKMTYSMLVTAPRETYTVHDLLTDSNSTFKKSFYSLNF